MSSTPHRFSPTPCGSAAATAAAPRTSCRRRCCVRGGTRRRSTRSEVPSGPGCSPSRATSPSTRTAPAASAAAPPAARRARPTEVGDTALAVVPAVDEIEQALDRWLIGDALATLSPDHRAVLVETYYRGRSVAEAAATLGVPPGTIKSRTFYALRALRLSLEERGVTT